MPALADHGTRGRYQWERRHGIQPCADCVAANTAYQAAWTWGGRIRPMDVSEAVDEIARVLHGPWLR